MTMEKARKLALNKLQWQVANGYRERYTELEIRETAEQLYFLTNMCSERGDKGGRGN